MKLTAHEVAEAPRLRSNLTITKHGTTYLHLGESYALSHALNAMVDVRIVMATGDEFMLSGRRYRSYATWTGRRGGFGPFAATNFPAPLLTARAGYSSP